MSLHKASFGWFTGTVRRWLVVIGTLGTLASGALFAASNTRFWAWLTIGFLVTWVIALGRTAHVEHRERMVAEATGRDRNDELRLHLMRRIRGGNRVAGLMSPDAASVNAKADWIGDTYVFLDESLGPVIAARFAKGREGEPPPGAIGVTPRVTYLQELLDGVDSLTVMEDWQPS